MTYVDADPTAIEGLPRASFGRRTLAPMGPHAHLAAERERLAGLTWSGFAVRALSPTIGAEVDGVDLARPLGDALVDELRRALVEYKLLVFRDQDITVEQQKAFASSFGDLEVHPFLLNAGEGDEEVIRFAKDETTGGYENSWHSDVSWREIPSMASVLRARAVPAVGGDTLWADMTAAYDGLSDSLRERIEGLVAVHDFLQSFGQALDDEARAEAREKFPPAEHPVVRTHPETGRRILYVNAIFTSHIVGMDRDEGEELLVRLLHQASVPEYQCRVSWEPNMVVMWDNRSTQHYACSDYWPQPRVMDRATIIGERPA